MHETHLDKPLWRQWLAAPVAAMALCWGMTAQAGVELEGVVLPETVVVYGQKLVLNGAGVRKRGYYKADVTALYLPEKRSTADAIYKLDGVRRIQLNVLRDFSSSTISRFFIADFKQVATEEEFKKLIPVVSLIGSAYSNIRHVTKGDVVNVDWVPGIGWLATYNGKLLQIDGANMTPINSELAYQVYLRMYIGEGAPEDLRNGLLGLTHLPRSRGD